MSLLQEYKRYDFTVTIEKLKEIQKEYDGEITVIINGMYYELKRPEKEG